VVANSRFLHCAVPFGFAQGPAKVGMTSFWENAIGVKTF
jgi:hypothetical protein